MCFGKALHHMYVEIALAVPPVALDLSRALALAVICASPFILLHEDVFTAPTDKRRKRSINRFLMRRARSLI